MSPTAARSLHALLIGIDNYPASPLSGCVNDIQQVATFLVERVGVPLSAIRKITAPRSTAQRPVDPSAVTPTYENLIIALQELASSSVQAGDSVFIYYSGHGSFQKNPVAESYFEGLVPLDYEQSGLLFDIELNGLLQAIANRSGDLSVVLDCCHSGGATRDPGGKHEDAQTRFLPLERNAPSVAVARIMALRSASTPATQTEPTAYSVVAACHADEKATECRLPSMPGEVHGMLTACLFELLGQVDSSDALARLRWSDIWETLKERVYKLNPNQRPQFLGPKERRVFGGPWKPQDIGYPVARSADGSYTVAAGALAGLGKGAQLAVYGPEPAQFPELNSDADKAARIGVLVIHSVSAATAKALPVNAGTAFELPAAARGRLIKQGEPDQLRISANSNVDPAVRKFLDDSQQRVNFRLLPENDPSAEVVLGQYADGDIWIGDDLNGPGAPVDLTAPGPIGRLYLKLAADVEDRSIALRAGLNHYAQYVIPLRTYRNGGFSLPNDSVIVRLLDANDEDRCQRMEQDAAQRVEVRKDERGRYRLQSEDQIAIHVQNSRSLDLHVFLLLCNMQGQIELLDHDVVVRSRSSKIFWNGGFIGQPFQFVSPDGHSWGIDRLIVIASDQRGMDLSMLVQRETLSEVIEQALYSKNTKPLARNVNALRWMASQTLIQIGGPE